MLTGYLLDIHNNILRGCHNNTLGILPKAETEMMTVWAADLGSYHRE